MIYLGGPWVWDGAGTPGPSYRAPSGTIAVVDLRTIPQQSVANHANGAGNGFFAAPDGTPIPEGYEVLATGDLREAVIGQPVRSTWQSIYGVTIPGDADRLIDCLSLTLGDLSDPTGDSGPKPLVPGVSPQGECTINLAGHSVVYRRKLTVQTGGSQHARRLRDLLRRDVEAIADSDPDPELWRRVLGFQKKKYGQAWDDDAEDWILTTKLRAKGKGKNGRTFADEPKTSYTESWPTNGAITSSQDRTWTYFETSGGMTVSSGLLQIASDGSRTWTNARMNSALSGSDTYSQHTVKAATPTEASMSLSIRKDSNDSTLTYYFFNVANSATHTIYKRVTGTYTLLFSPGGSPGDSTTNDVLQCTMTGSSIAGKRNGTSVVSGTDTSISSGTYCGVGMWSATGTWKLDDGEFADVGGAGPSRPDLGLLLGVS